MQTTLEDLQIISPYEAHAFRQAFARLLNMPDFAQSFQRYFPDIPLDAWLGQASTIHTVREFQHRWVGPSIDSLVRNTTDGLSVSGFDHLAKGEAYLFVANHRDILLDAGFICNESVRFGLETPKVCLGDNLLLSPLIIDLVKMNKGLTVKRGVTARELLRWSYTLSEVIGTSIHSKTDSVWIAQREGRAKDGNDLSQPGLFKMLALYGEGEFLNRLKALRLVPVATSYEYEPCAAWKAAEIYLTRLTGRYEKKLGEDLASMLEGLKAPKGRIHLAIGKEVAEELDRLPPAPKSRQAEAVAAQLDREIQKLFHCWPSHFAADALLRQDSVPKFGTRDDVKIFREYMQEQLSRLDPAIAKSEGLRQSFLELYANPVRNQEKMIKG